MNNDHSVFVAHCDYGKDGFEATVDLSMTRAELIESISSGELGFEKVIRVDEYNVAEGWARDVTAEILEAALPEIHEAPTADRQAWAFDHARDERKHEGVM